jgi:hypothetical protein
MQVRWLVGILVISHHMVARIPVKEGKFRCHCSFAILSRKKRKSLVEASSTIRWPATCLRATRDFFLFLRFFREIELFSMKFLYNSCKILTFQTCHHCHHSTEQ